MGTGSRRTRRGTTLPEPFEGEAAHVFYRALKYVILGPLLRIFFRPRIEGLENIPESGAAIVAGNHLSFSDHFVMPAILPRRITFLAKAEYFTGPGIKGRLTAAFFRGAGQIPVDRSGGKASQSAIDAALKVLGRGDLLGVYPEGTRSHDGRLYRGRTGVAVMALRADVPVIPCAMVGTFELQPPGRKFPRLGRVTIRFGRPLDFGRFAGMAGRAVRGAVGDRRDHVRDPGAVRAGVRRPVRRGGQGRAAAGGRGEGASAPPEVLLSRGPDGAPAAAFRSPPPGCAERGSAPGERSWSAAPYGRSVAA